MPLKRKKSKIYLISATLQLQPALSNVTTSLKPSPKSSKRSSPAPPPMLIYQLANAHEHRHNYAERAIQTFKNHFLSILHGCDTRWPSHLWCSLIPQTVITLNMLRGSQINPKLSAYNQLFGNFDFNRTLMAPLGTKCIIFE